MKKWLVVLLAAMLATTLLGCDKKEESKEEINLEETLTPQEAAKMVVEGKERLITFDAYKDGESIVMTKVNGDKDTYENMGYIAAQGLKISDNLLASEVINIEPECATGDTFEGWIEYKVVQYETDGDARKDYVKVSDELRTSEEIFASVMPDYDVVYAAKWESVPMEDYFYGYVIDSSILEKAYSFNLDPNDGILTLASNINFEEDLYIHDWTSGESFGASMETGWGTPLVAIEKEDAEFLGWTVYAGDEIAWPIEMVEEEGSTCFKIKEYCYLQLFNCQVYAENLSTEELKEIVCDDKYYYAIANWE